MGETNVCGKYCIIFLHSKLVSEDKELGWNVSLKFDVNEKKFKCSKEAGAALLSWSEGGVGSLLQGYILILCTGILEWRRKMYALASGTLSSVS